MQPGGKGRFATKASNFSKELNEDLLCQVFSLRDITGHPQTKRIDPTIVALVELLEGSHVALRSSLSQAVIGYWLCLSFGCGHVFVYRQATKELASLLLVRHDYHASAVFQGSGTFSHEFPVREECEFIRYPRRGCDAALRARRCLSPAKSYWFSTAASTLWLSTRPQLQNLGFKE